MTSCPAKPPSMAMLTCSMASDIGLFELLARSVDRHVAPEIRHLVVVPGADMTVFRRFETARRQIIAQEDVLPERMWKAPAALRHLAPVMSGFRRPVYLTSGGRVVRGWILQQFLKIEMSRRSTETAIMHVDSDVFFVRPFRPEDGFSDGKTRFFRATGNSANPMHATWVASSCDFLGLPVPESYQVHYIENCVLWCAELVRAMADRIETRQDKPLHQAIFLASTMSEYYLYGLFVDMCGQADRLAASDVSFCQSFWSADQTARLDVDAVHAGIAPGNFAVAIQSTNDFPLEERRKLYEALA